MTNITFTGSLRFTNDDMRRVLKYKAFRLGMIDATTSQTLTQMIQQQMADVELHSNWMVEVVQNDLDTLDTLDDALTASTGSTDAFPPRVDVLEWSDTRTKYGGIEQRMGDLANRIATILAREYETSAMATGWTELGRG